MIRTGYIDAPAWWAPYLVHGERAGLSGESLEEARAFRDLVQGKDTEIVATEGESFDGEWKGKPRRLVTYRLHYTGRGI